MLSFNHASPQEQTKSFVLLFMFGWGNPYCFFCVCVFLQIVDLHFHHVQQNPICADVFLFELSISQKTRGGFGPEQTEQINVEVMVVG